MKTSKDFSHIEGPYSFFQRHSTEERKLREHYKLLLAEHFGPSRSNPTQPLTVLDFGSGDGRFLAGVMDDLSVPPHLYDFNLVDSNPNYLQSARTFFSKHNHRTNTFESLVSFKKKADVLICNHVFYYVPNLDDSLHSLSQRMNRGSVGFVTLGSDANDLIQIWRGFFKEFKMRLPFNTVSDLESAFSRNHLLPQSQTTIESQLSYPDESMGRELTARFLFGDFLDWNKHRGYLDEVFDGYSEDGHVCLNLSDVVYTLTF